MVKKTLKLIIFLLLGCNLLMLSFFWITQVPSFFKWHGGKKVALSQGNLALSSPEQRPWMTIFVHGTFGSLLGFLSFSKVLQDSLEGTTYYSIAKKMRYDPFFYRDQPVLQKGLIPVQPTFDVSEHKEKSYAIYPLAKIYEMMSERVQGEQEKNYFYAFGWSGLISQQRRRLEAVRFYNILQDELDKFHRQGIYPRVRLLAHSHGGNLCLNLAAVEAILNLKKFTLPLEVSTNPDEQDSLLKMFGVFKQLARKQDVQSLEGQKRFEYIPIHKNLIIDELIVFGTPIQPETESFFLSPIFKKIYHIYSDEDIIQQLDGITTKQSFSNQRINPKFLADKRAAKRIKQVKIMYDRDVKGIDVKQAVVAAIEHDTKDSLWQKILAWSGSISKKSNDPTHKRLWFLSWEDYENEEPMHSLSPLPTVVFTPLLLKLLKDPQVADLIDFDINLSISDKNLEISLFKHGAASVKSKFLLPGQHLEELKNRIRLWKPSTSPHFSDVSSLYRHLL